MAPEWSEREAIAEAVRLVYSDDHEQLEHELAAMRRSMPIGHETVAREQNQSAARLLNESVGSEKQCVAEVYIIRNGSRCSRLSK